MKRLSRRSRVLAPALALLAAVGGLAIAPDRPVAALTSAENLPVSVNVSRTNQSSAGDRTLHDAPISFAQFDDSANTLNSATLSWNLSITGERSGGSRGTLRLSYGGDLAAEALTYDTPQKTFTLVGSAPVTSGHLGTGTFSPSNLLIRYTGISGTFPWGVEAAVTGTVTMTYDYTAGVADTTPPVVTVPSNVVAEQTSMAGAVVTYSGQSFTDNVGVTSLGCTPASGSTFGPGPTTVTCTASDAAGNTASDTFTVLVQDTTDPVVGIIVSSPVEATGPGGAPVPFWVSVADDSATASLDSCSPASGETFPIGSTTISCTASDASSNTGGDTATVVVQDTTDPTVVVPSNIVSEATGPSGATVSYPAATYSDAVGVVSSGCSPATNTSFSIGANTVTCSATDNAGNTGSDSFLITVEDTTDPVVVAPSNMVREATSSAGAVVTYPAATYSDAVGVVSSGCSPTSGSTFSIGVNTVVCNAADAAGNTGTDTFTITVSDTTPPVASVIVSSPVEATGPSGATVTYTVDATDDDSIDSVVCNPPSGSTFGIGTTTINCTVTDPSSNSTSASGSVTVVDTTAPTIAVPADFGVEQQSAAGSLVTYSTTFTDAVGVTSSSCAPASGSLFGPGATTVTCEAEDAAGNDASDSFVVTVSDSVAPAIVVPSDFGVEQESAAGSVVTYSATFTDAVGVTSSSCAPASGSAFGPGATTVTCEAEDAAGNDASDSFVVTVSDSVAPTIVVPTDFEVEQDSAAGSVVTYSATFADAVGVTSSSCAPASGSTFSPGPTLVTCVAEDAAGNDANDSFVVTVRDTTAPAASIVVDDTFEATGPSGATVTYTVDATDVDGIDSVVCTPLSGSVFPIGSTAIDCTITDASSNETRAMATVTVEDTTEPTVTVPTDVVAEAAGTDGAVADYSGQSFVDVVGVESSGCTPASGTTFAIGATTVICSASDAAGNTGSATFTVTVSDTTAPTATTPDDVVAEAAGPDGATVAFAVPADDAVGVDAIVCDHEPESTFAVGTTEVTCSVADAAGNSTAVSFSITIVDTTPPAVVDAPTIVAEATGVDGAPVTFDLDVSDVVGVATVECDPPSGSTMGIGTHAVTCTITDAAGNSTSTTFDVTVADTTAPAVPSDAPELSQSFVLPAGAQSGVINYELPDIVEAAGAVEVACTPASGSTFGVGVHDIECTATDGAGNSTPFTIEMVVAGASGGPSLPATGRGVHQWLLLGAFAIALGTFLSGSSRRVRRS
jgi:large repetitive protein